MIYLDNSATTRPLDEVTDLVAELMRHEFGNPSSLHHLGFEAEKRVAKAREQVAQALGANPSEIFFTAGGTESDNTAILRGAAKSRGRKKRIVTTQIEHPAVLESCRFLEEQGYEVVYLPVGKDGVVDLTAAKEAINQDTALISIMHVNNETGAVQPIREIGAMKGEALFHVDMVQSFGKLPINLSGEYKQVDMASFSGHKIHGPKGIGALYMKEGLHLTPYLLGGGQEKGFRSGTENVPGICGLGLAAERIYQQREAKNKELTRLVDLLMEELSSLKDVRFHRAEESAPHILNVSFLGTRGEVLLHTLEQKGVYVSTGSACSSHKKGGSHVLKAMGLSDKEIEGALRLSLSDMTTQEEILAAGEALRQAVTMFRRLGSFR